MQFRVLGDFLTGSAGVPPAMSAKRENELKDGSVRCAPAARCGRDARAPSKKVLLTIKLSRVSLESQLAVAAKMHKVGLVLFHQFRRSDFRSLTPNEIHLCMDRT